jgi:hypothetical protein
MKMLALRVVLHSQDDLAAKGAVQAPRSTRMPSFAPTEDGAGSAAPAAVPRTKSKPENDIAVQQQR